MVRSLRDKAAYEAPLFDENNAFLVAASVFPYFYALVGERNPKAAPKPKPHSEYTQLACDAFELIRRDGPYRRLMGAQAEERGDDDIAFAEDRLAVTGGDESTDYGEEAPAATAAAAAQVSAARTLGTLVEIIKPWRNRFAIVVRSSN